MVLATAMAARAQAPSAAASSVAASPPPIEDYGRLPAMDLVRLSPRGERYAYVGRLDGKAYIVVATTSNEPLAKVPIGKSKVISLDWAGEDHLIITTTQTVNMGIDFHGRKSELEGAASLDLKAHKLVPIFGGRDNTRVAHTVVGQYGVAQIDGRWYGFFGAYTYNGLGLLRQDQYRRFIADLYRVDLSTGVFRIVGDGDGDGDGQPGVTGWLVGHDGSVIARSYYDDASGDWRVVGAWPRYLTLASGHNQLGGPSIIGFGKTADRVIVNTPVESGSEDMEIPLAGGAAVPVTAEPNGVDELIDPVSQLWIGERHDDDGLTSTLFDPVKQAEMEAVSKALDGYIPHLISYSADFEHLIIESEGGEDSGTYWLFNFADGPGKAVALGMKYPSIGSDMVGPVRMIDYKAADGLALRGVLTLPPGRAAKDLPVVVMPHGGPVSRDYPGFDYWAQAFAARGYAVFQPNFRGSSGYGGALRDAGFGEWGRKMQTDVSDGLAELARQGIVDPKRACIVGWSYGGYAALAGVTVQQHLYRCAVSMAGVADLGGFLSYEDDKAGWDSSALRFWKKFMGVTSHWSNAQVNVISPAQLAAKADAPILLLHGDNDTTVPIDQSQAMKRALEGAGKPVEFVELPGADHWLLEEDARVAMLKASVDFVLKYDPPDPPPAAVAAK